MVRSIAISACLSVTVITSVDTRLKAATAIIIAKIINIILFSVFTAANHVRFCIDQSMATIPGGNAPLRLDETSGAKYMLSNLTRSPVGKRFCVKAAASFQ